MVIQGNFIYPVSQCFEGFMDVGTTPMLIKVGAEPVNGRNHIMVSLPASSPAAAVYIGSENVSVGTGIPVASDSGMIIPVNSAARADKLYMVADTACKVQLTEFVE